MRRLFTLALTAVLLAGSAASATVPSAAVSAPGPVRIMIAGDSIAAGFPLSCPDGTMFGDHGAFRDWVALSGVNAVYVGSQQSTCYASDVHHEGYPGWTIGQLADNIAGLLAANPADVLILRVGVNDAKASGGFRSAEQMAADYTRLIEAARAQSPAIRILAGEVIGPNASVNTEFARASITAAKFNRLLPTIVAPYGDAVHIGRNSLITTRGLGDGLHPSTDGYLALAWITIHQPDGIWPWLSADPPAATDTGALLLLDPFAATGVCQIRVITGQETSA